MLQRNFSIVAQAIPQAVLIALIMGLGGILTGSAALALLIPTIRGKQAEAARDHATAAKTEVDLQAAIAAAAASLVEPLTKRLNDAEAEIRDVSEENRILRIRIRSCEMSIDQLREGVNILMKQLVENNLEPRWRPQP
jgi:hypothetical protein